MKGTAALRVKLSVLGWETEDSEFQHRLPTCALNRVATKKSGQVRFSSSSTSVYRISVAPDSLYDVTIQFANNVDDCFVFSFIQLPRNARIATCAACNDMFPMIFLATLPTKTEVV